MVDRTEEDKKKEDIKDVGPKLPLAPIQRIMKEQGIKKISKNALIEVRMILHDILRDTSRKIILHTNHRKAKISTREDVLMAIR